MRKAILFAALISFAAGAAAHVTPNVSLVRRGEFVRQSFPEASKFFERELDGRSLDAAAQVSGWRPSSDEARLYVARTAEGALVGTVIFLWVPSQHGPVGIGAAFDSAGTLRHAAVTDVGTEPLAWVGPLVENKGLEAFSGLPLDGTPDPGRISTAGAGAMTRYYAKVICDGIRRAQAIERAARSAIR